jgi:hypothetical protein
VKKGYFFCTPVSADGSQLHIFQIFPKAALTMEAAEKTVSKLHCHEKNAILDVIMMHDHTKRRKFTS